MLSKLLRYGRLSLLPLILLLLILGMTTSALPRAADVETLPPTAVTFLETDNPTMTTPAAPAAPLMLDVTTYAILENFFYTKDSVALMFKKDENKELAYAQTLATAYSRNMVKTYLCLVPTAYEFVDTAAIAPKEKPKDSQREAMERIRAALPASVTWVDGYGALETSEVESNYFRGDSRLPAQAAYKLYQSFAKAAGFAPVPLSAYQEESLLYYGDLYYKEPLLGIRNRPDHFRYYPVSNQNYGAFFYDENGGGRWNTVPIIDTRRATPDDMNDMLYYPIFLSGDPAMGILESGVKNGRRLLVVSDSTDNAFVPFLLPHYETIYTIDPTIYRYSIPSFLNEQRIGEVLYMNTMLSAVDETFIRPLAQRVGADVETLLTAPPPRKKKPA